MTNEQIDELVNRFLGWRLPQDFSPDFFIKFDREAAIRLHDSTNGTAWPIGTNLLNADQAREMLKFLLASPVAPRG